VDLKVRSICFLLNDLHKIFPPRWITISVLALPAAPEEAFEFAAEFATWLAISVVSRSVVALATMVAMVAARVV
jgi:hypothetical protein